MQTQKVLLISALAIALISGPACKKEKDNSPDPSDKTKTELIVSSAWKLQKAEAVGFGDVTSQIEACAADNTLTFTSTVENQGTGIIDEGATKCDASDPQSLPFTWSIFENGTILRSSIALFPDGSTDFKLVTLNATNMVVSQEVTYAPLPPTTVTFTLKH